MDILVFLITLCLYALFIGSDLPQVEHPDEPKVVRRAIAMGTGDLNPHFFLYPTLWTYLVFLTQGLTSLAALFLGLVDGMDELGSMVFTNPAFFFIPPRLLAAALGAGAVWLAWRIGSRVSPICGLSTGLMLALFPPLIAHARFATGDVPVAFFVLLCLYACVNGVQHSLSERRWTAWAGALAGLAASIKYNGILALGAVWMMLLLKHSGAATERALRLRTATVASGLAALAFLCTSPFSLIDYPAFQAGLRGLIAGTVSIEGSQRDLLYYVRLVVAGHGPVAALMAAAGWLAVLAGRLGDGTRREAVVMASCFAPYYLVIMLTDYKAARFYLPMAVCIPLGVGFALTALTASHPIRRMTLTARRFTHALLLAVLVLPAGAGALEVKRTQFRETAAKLARQWVLSHIPPGTTVFVDLNSRVTLPPDRETVTRRMAGWLSEGGKPAEQLIAAYSYYLKTDLPCSGYRMVPTMAVELNTWASGSDPERDYEAGRIDGVELIIAPKSAFGSTGNPSRVDFYRLVRKRYHEVAVFTDGAGGQVVIYQFLQERSQTGSATGP